MQERISPSGSDFADVIVQFHPDHNTVGIGLEPRSELPSLHFVDAIYGGVPSQTAIGKILAQTRPEFANLAFQSSDIEAEFFNNLGRACLDAVTGSSALDGLWTWLDRPGTNRLIRLLRKGRDISFGKDE